MWTKLRAAEQTVSWSVVQIAQDEAEININMRETEWLRADAQRVLFTSSSLICCGLFKEVICDFAGEMSKQCHNGFGCVFRLMSPFI